MRSNLAYLVLALAACGGDPKTTTVDAPTVQVDARPADAGIDAPVDPRNRTITLPGSANGLLWDDSVSTLYLTNGNTNSLIQYSDAAGFMQLGVLPSTTGGASLGEIVKRPGGTILTANFGFGMGGTIFKTTSAGVSTSIAGLAADRKRVGFTQDSAGVMYDAWFTGTGAAPVGAVSTVVLVNMGASATETEIATGFKKVVGLVATPTAVFVSDQTQKSIFKIAIPGNTVTTVTAALATADLLAMMPNGDLLTGGGANVYRVTQDGTITTLFSGFEQVHGMAYDPTMKRLFIVDHSATVGTPDKLHVRPLEN